MNLIAKYFFRGVVIVVPIVITGYVFYLAFVTVDRLIPFPFPGVGFLVTIAVVLAVGAAASNFIGRRLLALPDRLFKRAPIVKIVYSSVRDLIEAFVGDQKRFDRPVLVQLSDVVDAKVVGFVTRQDLEFLRIEGHVAVYLPQSYNFAGNLLVVPTERISPIDAESSRVMAFVVSGGVSGVD
ncbi:MAG: DUF502 domain-containing protein [Thermoanaerobaculia bacterium]